MSPKVAPCAVSVHRVAVAFLAVRARMPAEMEQGALQATPVVTAFLYRRGRVLLLRRSERVGTYRARWAGVSGYLERGSLPQARRELREEVGLSPDQVTLRGLGIPLILRDPEVEPPWIVFPFLFRTGRGCGDLHRLEGGLRCRLASTRRSRRALRCRLRAEEKLRNNDDEERDRDQGH